MGGIDPDYRRAFPWDESRWDHGLLESIRALVAPPRRPSRRCGPMACQVVVRGGIGARLPARGRLRDAGGRPEHGRRGRARGPRRVERRGERRGVRGGRSVVGAPRDRARTRAAAASLASRRRPVGRAPTALRSRHPIRLNPARPRSRHEVPVTGPRTGRTYTHVMSALPMALPTELESTFVGALDPTGKLVAALGALGPVADRDVVVVDAPDGPIARRAHRRGRAAERRSISQARSGWHSMMGRPTSSSACGPRSAASTGQRSPRSDRVLRPGGRHLAVHDYGRDDVSRSPRRAPRVRRLEPAHRAVPRRRLPRPRRALLLGVRVAGRGHDASCPPRSASAGRRSRRTLKRPRLSYNVAVYHRTRP